MSVQEFENAFENAADKRGQLSQRHQQLCNSVSAEDTGILQQRLLLLDTQWDEILHQVALRKQRIEERLSRWSMFGDRYKDLVDGIDTMEKKISTNKEFNIEDLLYKLQNVRNVQ